MSNADKIIANRILLEKANTARRAAERACSIFELGCKDEIIAKAQITVQERDKVACCALEVLPLVAAAALNLDVDECRKYHTRYLGRSFTTQSTRRGFAMRVLSSMSIQFVTNSDIRLCLDVLFDEPGAVWGVAKHYADKIDDKIFGEGVLLE